MRCESAGEVPGKRGFVKDAGGVVVSLYRAQPTKTLAPQGSKKGDQVNYLSRLASSMADYGSKTRFEPLFTLYAVLVAGLVAALECSILEVIFVCASLTNSMALLRCSWPPVWAMVS